MRIEWVATRVVPFLVRAFLDLVGHLKGERGETDAAIDSSGNRRQETRKLVKRERDRKAGALPGSGVDRGGAACFFDRDGHQEESEAVLAAAGPGFAVESHAIIGDSQSNAMVDGGQPDRYLAGPRILVGVAEGFLRGVVQQRGAASRNLDAVVWGFPQDSGSLLAQRCSEPVDAPGQPQGVEVNGAPVGDDAADGSGLA